ncbi:MarR family winged helix-turn-helix transcriptional regulator [Streptococcus loxodontisalivarius]|uniref:DNA-binding MarR family transcriptional regulator n=1 Tax=Streptococcus loxodontisalivarius TaxID=1349415 RepID=A0ABS2PR10_9STRE|nr:MarR family transcriptional regulator [Streptococcus loxodontisalivarius]MBM7642483.1 DNA-binding MarR family transcriptional regulator [Streptococcus loxodontisalivarius]
MGEELDKDLAIKSMVVMRKAFRTIDAYVSESYKYDDLTPTQFGVLDVLLAKGTMKIGALIDSMLATSGNMTVVIKNMEKKGWITRTTCPSDKRSYLVALTDEGRRIIEHNLPIHQQRVREAFSVLTTDEQAQLIDLLKKFKNL